MVNREKTRLADAITREYTWQDSSIAAGQRTHRQRIGWGIAPDRQCGTGASHKPGAGWPCLPVGNTARVSKTPYNVRAYGRGRTNFPEGLWYSSRHPFDRFLKKIIEERIAGRNARAREKDCGCASRGSRSQKSKTKDRNGSWCFKRPGWSGNLARERGQTLHSRQRLPTCRRDQPAS